MWKSKAFQFWEALSAQKLLGRIIDVTEEKTEHRLWNGTISRRWNCALHPCIRVMSCPSCYLQAYLLIHMWHSYIFLNIMSSERQCHDIHLYRKHAVSASNMQLPWSHSLNEMFIYMVEKSSQIDAKIGINSPLEILSPGFCPMSPVDGSPGSQLYYCQFMEEGRIRFIVWKGCPHSLEMGSVGKTAVLWFSHILPPSGFSMQVHKLLKINCSFLYVTCTFSLHIKLFGENEDYNAIAQ